MVSLIIIRILQISSFCAHYFRVICIGININNPTENHFGHIPLPLGPRLLSSLLNNSSLAALLLVIPRMLVLFCDTLIALLRSFSPDNMIAWATLSASANSTQAHPFGRFVVFYLRIVTRTIVPQSSKIASSSWFVAPQSTLWTKTDLVSSYLRITSADPFLAATGTASSYILDSGCYTMPGSMAVLIWIIIMSFKNQRIQQLALDSTTANQTISQNQIRLSFKQEKTKEDPPLALPSCKICLSEVQLTRKQEQGLIAPCLCTGTVKYVHEECLVSWLNTVVQRNLENGRNTTEVACEICKCEYLYETTSRYACNQRQEIKNNIRLNWGIFGLGVFFILAAIGGLLTIGIMVATHKMSFKENSVEQNMLVAIIVVLCILFIAWVLRLGYLFFMKKMYFIGRVLERPVTNGVYERKSGLIQDSNDELNIQRHL